MELNGTTYDDGTDPEVARILDAAIARHQTDRQHNYRLRLFLGDRETGRDWGEENDVIGYIGRSGGIHIPILLANSRSMGGGGILTACILKIMRGTRVLYTHPKYHQETHTVLDTSPTQDASVYDAGYRASVYKGNVNVANFKTFEQARRYVAFMRGERMSK